MFQLTENASDLTTINTLEGCFRHKWLPFCLSCSQDEFQGRMEETFGDLGGVGVAEDLVVSGKDESDHYRNLMKVVVRARERNIRVKLEKSVVFSSFAT